MSLQGRWERNAELAVAGRASGAVYVTTSWDDGHVLDHAMAGLLETYDLPGTFYVAPRNIELPVRERLGERGTKLIGERFEIGGHTLTHLRLTTMADEHAMREIVDGKAELEQTLGAPLRSFCYPGGEYGPAHPAMVREAGFAIGRTVERGVTAPTPPYEMATTTHAYRHLVDGKMAMRLAGGNRLLAAKYFWNWDVMAIAQFDLMLATGGVFHLWGHSWEVEKNGDWARLERVFAHIARRPGVRYVDNGELAGVGDAV
jgi:peptidoglycan/xylan/chitin deacetylase (PgdA/CDA1 family)